MYSIVHLRIEGFKVRIEGFKKLLEQLKVKVDTCKKTEEALLARFKDLRNAGIQRFVPLLLQTVSRVLRLASTDRVCRLTRGVCRQVHTFDAKFEQLCRDRIKTREGNTRGKNTGEDAARTGEESLERIASLCLELSYTKGRDLRQRTRSAHKPQEASTLIELLRTALDAGPELESLANDAIRNTHTAETVELIKPTKPTKGLQRTVQKVQEEYEVQRTCRAMRHAPACPHLPPHPAHISSGGRRGRETTRASSTS